MLFEYIVQRPKCQSIIALAPISFIVILFLGECYQLYKNTFILLVLYPIIPP